MIVTKDDTALALGSGDLEVLATPRMVAWMENAAMNAAKEYCAEGETTVGTMVSITHTRATPVSEKVTTEAVLVEREGRRLLFKIAASDSKGIIGQGTHERFVVNVEKFIAKL